MPFDIVIRFETPVDLGRFFEVWRLAFPGCVYGDLPRNSPETNPVWDEMPDILKEALSEMPDRVGMSCEKLETSIELTATKSERITDLIGELRGPYGWTTELSVLCRELKGVATARIDGRVYAPEEKDSPAVD